VEIVLSTGGIVRGRVDWPGGEPAQEAVVLLREQAAQRFGPVEGNEHETRANA
jgi:hypothetical protein